MVFLMETKLDSKRMKTVRRRYEYGNDTDVDAERFRGNLCLSWKDDITVKLRSFLKHHIDVLLKDHNGNGCL